LIVHDVTELRVDRQEVVLMLHDFTFRTPDEVLAGLVGMSTTSAHAMVQKGEDDPGRNGESQTREPGMAGMAPDAPGMNMAESVMSASGAMRMDLNDVNYDAFLANDRTLSDPEIVRVERS